ncbi:DUF1499 domain-containing protein [Reinekea thalattae]|nr:DUF1499 domain-containing protein [Reinekea thalattae]
MKLLKRPNWLANLILLVSMGCIAAIIAAVFGVRDGSMDFRSATGIIRHALEVGAVVLICSVLMLVFVRETRLKMLTASLLIAIPMLGAYLLQPAPTPNATPGERPAPLNDISTDTSNPPIFEAVAAIRPEGSNTLTYPGEKAAILQAERFPSIAPMATHLSAEQAYDVVLELIEKNGWQLIEANLPEGKIEAVAATIIFNFKDDIVFRVVPTNTGSIVDMRSHSRVGRGDMNVNGNRVIAFIENFNKMAANR